MSYTYTFLYVCNTTPMSMKTQKCIFPYTHTSTRPFMLKFVMLPLLAQFFIYFDIWKHDLSEHRNLEGVPLWHFFPIKIVESQQNINLYEKNENPDVYNIMKNIKKKSSFECVIINSVTGTFTAQFIYTSMPLK